MNLIRNNVKYSSNRPDAKIEKGLREDPALHIYYIRDNDEGFDMKCTGGLFRVFEQLYLNTDFEGTGIGIVLVKALSANTIKWFGRVYASKRCHLLLHYSKNARH